MATTIITTRVLLQLQLLQAAETHLLLQQLLHQVLLDENRMMVIHAQVFAVLVVMIVHPLIMTWHDITCPLATL